MRRLSVGTRDELAEAAARRYAEADRHERGRILDELTSLTGQHRKHAARLLRGGGAGKRHDARPERRIYDDATRESLVVIWKAWDRVCGKRLRPLMPMLVEAMERHGHLQLAAEVRSGLLSMSAATIDRALRDVRRRSGGRTRRRAAPSAAVRRSVAVRTFEGWDDPPPGFMEADLVAHSGPTARGSFVQTLTDIATGWTECAPVLVREQSLLTAVLGEIRKLLPFPLLGLDTDNDSVFLNETVRDYCQAAGITFTRCRPYRKNDQAWVEQKNGAVVRRAVGYRRFEGLEAAAALARLYRSLRLFVNYFQPSFKLAGKAREGARVRKRYSISATVGRPTNTGHRAAGDGGGVRDAGSGAAPERHPSGPGAARRDCRSTSHGSNAGSRRSNTRAVPRQPAHGVAAGRGAPDIARERESEAGPAASRSVRGGHRRGPQLVRCRAMADEPRAVRAPASGATRQIPGWPATNAAAADQGLAPGQVPRDGVRRDRRKPTDARLMRLPQRSVGHVHADGANPAAEITHLGASVASATECSRLTASSIVPWQCVAVKPWPSAHPLARAAGLDCAALPRSGH